MPPGEVAARVAASRNTRPNRPRPVPYSSASPRVLLHQFADGEQGAVHHHGWPAVLGHGHRRSPRYRGKNMCGQVLRVDPRRCGPPSKSASASGDGLLSPPSRPSCLKPGPAGPGRSAVGSCLRCSANGGRCGRPTHPAGCGGSAAAPGAPGSDDALSPYGAHHRSGCSGRWRSRCHRCCVNLQALGSPLAYSGAPATRSLRRWR